MSTDNEERERFFTLNAEEVNIVFAAVTRAQHDFDGMAKTTTSEVLRKGYGNNAKAAWRIANRISEWKQRNGA